MTKAKTKECPDCGGRGEIKHPLVRHTCQTCDGWGEVKLNGKKLDREKIKCPT